MLRCLYYIVVSTTFFGCGWFEPAAPIPTKTKHDILISKVELYKNLAREGQHGVDSLIGCDGLLWGSLNNYSNMPFEIDRYRNENKWFRSKSHDCYPERSHSTISRDQLLGLYYALIRGSRLDLAYGISDYAEANGFIMGEGSLSATHMTANMLGLLGRVIHHLGGMSKYRHYPVILFPGAKKYHAHLQALAIILIHKIEGGIGQTYLDIVREQHARNPRNALFALLSSIYDSTPVDKVLDILLDENLFPADRLPEPSDRCGFYLWQYDVDQQNHWGTGTFWEPCSINEAFGGIDFLFAATLYLEEVRYAKDNGSHTISKLWRRD